MRLPPLLLAALATALLLAAPSSAGAVVVGIADQKADMFSDKRFKRLGIRHVRLNVAWDALSSQWQRDELDRWMDAAEKADVHPLVSFGHSRVERRKLPTPSRFGYEFRRFRERYPWVRSFATWNEANHCGEPTCNRPRLVAAYYRALRRECDNCKLLAAELLDQPNMVRWAREFTRAAKHEPKRWGLHNYVTANRFRTDRTEDLLAAVEGQVWLTEVGGIVKRRNRGRTKRGRIKRIPESPSHAARVTRFIFDDLVPLNRRISRVYLYHWNASGPRDSWDSALITPGGRPRPAFRILERVLRDNEGTRLRRSRAQRRTRGQRRRR